MDVFMLTMAHFEDADWETALEAGAVFATLYGAMEYGGGVRGILHSVRRSPY